MSGNKHCLNLFSYLFRSIAFPHIVLRLLECWKGGKYTNTGCPCSCAISTAGSTASPYYVQVNITQRLCYPTCAENTPVFAPQFALVGVSQVGTGQYAATFRVQGIISYVPCNGGCCTKSQPLSGTFTIPIASATTPTAVTVTAGATVNAISATACQTCSRTFVSETPLSVTVTTAG